MTKAQDVDAWLDAYDNPMRPVVSAISDVALAADPRITEAVKRQAKTFVYNGNISSFFPMAKKHASLMFHRGAEIPGDFPNLEGDGEEARAPDHRWGGCFGHVRPAGLRHHQMCRYDRRVL